MSVLQEPDSSFCAKSGGAAVIASGLVVAYDTGPIDLELPIKDEVGVIKQKLTLRVTFIADSTPGGASRWEIKQFPDNPALLELHMVNAPKGASGLPNPISLWKSPTDSILVAVRFYTVPDAPPTLAFTFYRKGEVQT